MGFIEIESLAYVVLLVILDATKIEIERISTFAVLAAMLIIGSASIDLKGSPKVPQILTCLGEVSYSIFLIH
ncbi:hypothetical protein [Microcoleus sp. F4-D5]|uniref:hypothetical protein n=1 Tax=Microcoleus sp. F4-D5 TaxID=2818760 RepID=UPI002FD6A3B7